MPSINVAFLPELLTDDALTGQVVVIIDVLRATTTITQALAAGAKCVIPCLEVAQAERLRNDLGAAAVLGGERGGVKISGFDLGNSPTEYTAAAVGGKTLIFTTTNGTRAMQCARQADRVLLGAFVNLSALGAQLKHVNHVEILCAGTDRQVTREDVLLAGALAHDLTLASDSPQLNDQARIALDCWCSVTRESAHDHRQLHTELRNSLGGRNLIELGQADDIRIAAHIDSVPVVPELDLAAWRITAAK